MIIMAGFSVRGTNPSAWESGGLSEDYAIGFRPDPQEGEQRP
jgi:hypothetical protein